jgi:hypothetical protein
VGVFAFFEIPINVVLFFIKNGPDFLKKYFEKRKNFGAIAKFNTKIVLRQKTRLLKFEYFV